MNFTKAILVTLLMLATLLSFAAEHGHNEHAEEAEKGSHNGRLLVSGDFMLELTIFERGVPPEYRAWAFDHGEKITPDEVIVNVELTRLGGLVNSFTFSQVEDYLRGEGVVEEPHSFDVKVTAWYQAESHEWVFESYEGRTDVSADIASKAGIVSYQAGAGVINHNILLYGKTSPDPQQISHVAARYPGLIQSIGPALGEAVTKGEVIATVESNSSLQIYQIKAPISGTVVEKHANPGEMASNESLMTIANYDSLWVDLSVFPGDMGKVKPGLPVVVSLNDISETSSISYLNSGDGSSPMVIARVPLMNPELSWSPGLLVEALVQVEQVSVDLMIDNRALQSFRDWQVVFIQIGNTYEIRPVTLGRSDGEFTEVLEGLNVGDNYVVENSYLLKADIEKEGASHDH